MKKITNVFAIIMVMVLTLTVGSCKKCKNEDPRARIINNASVKASVQIQTTGGNTTNMNNVMPGSTSDYSSFSAGDVVFTVSVGNKVNVVTSVKMEKCFEYDIAIDENGAVNSTAKDRNE
jgi:hypothetical protein